MQEQIARNWWVLLIRGLAGVLFGLAAFLWPMLTLGVLIAFFGVYALIDGCASVVLALRRRNRDESWWAMLIRGILGILVGVLAFVMPGITAVSLVLLIGAWAILSGAFEIAAAIRLRRVIQNEWLLGLSGTLSLLLGIYLLLFPAAGALALVWWIGAFAFAAGVLLIALAFRVRNLGREAPRQRAAA